MDILVVGGGGREHAIIRKLKESPRVGTIYCAPGNGGISADAVCVDIGAKDIEKMVAFAGEKAVDFVVVAPDDPLAIGMVDAFDAAGFLAFGPTKAAARIESSKVFSKHLMKKYGIPTAEYEVFDDAVEAMNYISDRNRYPVVIKADGLALGKGVVIPESRKEAEEALQSIMGERIFGESGSRVVVEEFLTGPEVSVLAFVEGSTVVPMVSAMDHKRALDGNQGPNTGGMGTVSPNPHYTPEMATLCMETIFQPTADAMVAEGCPFRGCLFFGLMLTPNGPKVIEYNCRFGDPETQVVLPLLDSDLLEVFLAVAKGKNALGNIAPGKLAEIAPSIRWKNAHAACVVAASGGYPGKYETGLPISGLDSGGQCPEVTVYHAGTKRQGNDYLTAGGRVLGVTATGATLEEALDAAYHGIEVISFDGMHYRKDIGKY